MSECSLNITPAHSFLSNRIDRKNAFQSFSCRHVYSKSYPAAPLWAVIYPASLHILILAHFNHKIEDTKGDRVFERFLPPIVI